MEKKLSKGRELFVGNYTNPEDPHCFHNGTQAYRKAFPAANEKTAAKEASRLLRLPEVKSEIERIFEAQGLTPELDSKVLYDHTTGQATRQQKRYVPATDATGKQIYDDSGNPLLRLVEIVELSPSFKDQQNAIDLKHKITGHYKKIDAEADIAKEEYARLIRETNFPVRNLRDVTPKEKEE